MELSKQQQLEFLFSIVTEASKWEKSIGDDRDSIRMEVEERIANLLRGGEVIKNGRIQSILYPDQSESIQQPATPMSSKTAWEHARRRVRIGKRYAWVLKEHTERVPREDSPNRTRWAVKAEFAEQYKEKEAT